MQTSILLGRRFFLHPKGYLLSSAVPFTRNVRYNNIKLTFVSSIKYDIMHVSRKHYRSVYVYRGSQHGEKLQAHSLYAVYVKYKIKAGTCMKKHFLDLVSIILLISILLSGCSAEFPATGKPDTSEAHEPSSSDSVTVISFDEHPEAMTKVSDNAFQSVSRNVFEGYALSENDTPENGVYTMSTNTPGEVSIIFAGDIDFDPGYSNMNALAGRSGGIRDCISSDLQDLLSGNDICMLNNEFPYSDRGNPTPDKKYTFRAKPDSVNMLKELGVDIVSLANNHAYDYGPDALLDTFDTLSSAGIPYVGAGHNINEAEKPVYFISGGMKIAVVAATQIERGGSPDTREATVSSPGVLRTQEPEKFLKVISSAAADSDFVIVYVHWGTENVNQYEQSQADLAASYADAGADLIIGDHPHVLQGFGYVDNVPVIYSLGNFWFNSKNLDNCVVVAKIKDSSLESLQFVPCRQHDCYTEMMHPGTTGDYERIISEMRDYSADNADISDDGYVTQK